MIKYIEIKQSGEEKNTFLYFADWLNHSEVYSYLVRLGDIELISAGTAQRYEECITHHGSSFTLNIRATKEKLSYSDIHGCIVRDGLMCSNSPSLLKRLAQVCATEVNSTVYSIDQMVGHIPEEDRGCQFNCRIENHYLIEY